MTILELDSMIAAKKIEMGEEFEPLGDISNKENVHRHQSEKAQPKTSLLPKEKE